MSSSLLSLKAEIGATSAALMKRKEAGESVRLTGPRKTDRKPTVWQKRNKGVEDRNQRDLQLQLSEETRLDTRANMEKKTKIYNNLQKGRTGGLTEEHIDNLSFIPREDASGSDTSSDYGSDDSQDDPMITYQDDFGRDRTVRRSEVPREFMLPAKTKEDPWDDPYVEYNNPNHYYVYERTEEELRKIEQDHAETPLQKHYDSKSEVRARGAAFMSLGHGEERVKNQADLRELRNETETNRAEFGAITPLPGAESRAEPMPMKGAAKRKAEQDKRKQMILERQGKRPKTSANDTAASGDLSAAESFLNGIDLPLRGIGS